MPDRKTVKAAVCSLGFLILGLASCSGLGTSKDPTDFEVQVFLNRSGENPVKNVTLENTVDCVVAVYADGKHVEETRELTRTDGTPVCRPGTLFDLPLFEKGPELGVFQYSTDRQSGTVKFVVTMLDYKNAGLAQGSVEANVAPGKDLFYELIVDTCPDGECPISVVK